jgi:cytochrome c biogenesis protein CcmG, thiol:disulfide interchange protein DsbE
MPELAENTQVQASQHQNKRRRRILIFSVVSLLNLALIALLLKLLLTPAPNAAVADPLIGHPAPNFSLALVRPSTGKSLLSLSNFKGKAIVLNFWASWCDPCKEEAPILENAWKQMQAQGKTIVFLGIDFQDAHNDAISFLQSNGITYLTVLDADGSVASKYHIVSLPDTIFINQQGIVVSKVSQQITVQELSSNLQLISH